MNKIDKVWIAASLGPLLALSILLPLASLLSQWYLPPLRSPALFFISIFLAVGVGVVAINTLNISTYQKTIVLIMYIPFSAFCLVVFSIVLACLVGQCL